MIADATRARALEILTAAEVLVGQGWVQKVAEKKGSDGKLCYCTGGAFQRVRESWALGSLSPAYGMARLAFERAIGDESIPLPLRARASDAMRSWAFTVGWNDMKGRTQIEVLAAFETAKGYLR